ncbi:N-acetylglucosamine kinase [Sphingosinicella sp. BN140058]|uniref:N-acetylglucosamine kinase n=1 Tax=Sphingosinicella sp. BN140058 TaxID=1892855 RepID=UPI0010127715|nr:BadF/BadG/BcrA/BcrD ATPase family protein [Sphingosinicella sp. BN140058]QAY78205.1 N-acetylglucosamine kinase [Sphingosinicella sp. BN140058]
MTADGLFLGVDGGGTKTEFVCVDAAGKVVARAITGTTYHLQVGHAVVVERLQEGIGTVCRDLGITPAGIEFGFFGLPAFGEDADADIVLEQACGRLLGHDRYACGNDVVCGWAGSLGCEDGINIVAGTGSIGYGEHQGRTARAGGWGEVFGDEGSAYWIAVQGLGLFSRMSDGRAPREAFYDRMRVALAFEQDLDLCQRVMGPPAMPRGDIAGLAKLVSEAAHDGERGAQAILAGAADELAALAFAVRKQLDYPEGVPAQISWSGGVLLQEHLVRDAFLARLAESGAFEPVEPRFPPAQGAALNARRLADIRRTG